MKKLLLLLVALIATATAWSQDFTPLQFGVDNQFEISRDDLYLSFTPEETDYYVISTVSDVAHDICINLWSDSLFYAYCEPDELQQTYISNLGYPHKLYAGETYRMNLYTDDYDFTGTATVTISKGYLVSPDAESADLTNVLYPLPVAAYEGQEVKLTASPGVTINNLTATSGGEPVAITADDTGMVFSFTMPAADVVISGSYEMPSLQLGDNEVDLTAEGSQFAFVPDESGAYVITMNCGAEAQIYLVLNNDLVTIGYAPEGETLTMGAMLEANVTYYVQMMIREGVVEGANLNIAKRELPPITVGENAIDVPYVATFDYPFTPPVSGDYTFYTTDDGAIFPRVNLFVGDLQIGSYYNDNSDLNFTVSMVAGCTYTFKAAASPNYPHMSTLHLTVVSHQVIPETFSYIDENRETKSHEAIVLTGDETWLGMDEQESWYVAKGTLNYTQTLNIAGDVHLILANGAVMNIGSEASPVSGKGIDGSEYYSNLTIYGQTLDDDTAGHLNINTDDGCIYVAGDYAQHSGNVTANSSDGGGVEPWYNFAFTGGTLYVTADKNAIYNDDNVDILGGKLSAICVGNYYGIYSLKGIVTFGWKSLDDEFTISNFTYASAYSDIKIIDGQAFTDGENIYDSTTPPAVLWALTNVTLRPVATFAISLPESFEHGTVICDKQTAYEGQTVMLTVTPDNGYELETLTVTFTNEDEPSGAPMRLQGGSLELTPGENGTYTFAMPAQPVTVNATFKESTPTGIEEINAANSKTGQRYNLMGQPVGKGYKGIVIENGKKILVK